MLSITLKSRWLIATFVAGSLIDLLKFLSAAIVLSLSACVIWVITFLVDVILSHSLRAGQNVKHHDLPPIRFEASPYGPFINTIREYLALYLASDAITAEWTAETLDEMLPANRYLKIPSVFVPSSVLFAWGLWETIVQFACQIPSDHYKQEKLVELIVALSKRPAVLVRHHDTLLRFWDAMPQYNIFITVYGSMFFFADERRQQGDRTHQTNLMAFLARVQATGLPYGLTFGAVWSLHTALDEERRDILPWAALWIKHCGEYLWWFVSQASNDGVILDKQRWKHYMDRFDKLASDGRNGRYVRVLAQDAFCKMARLSDSAPNPKYDNMGQQRWETILAREGPHGVFEEPMAPDLWVEEEEGEAAEDVYEAELIFHMELEEEEEDPNGFHPLRPRGGFMLYSDVTEDDENTIARAA